MSTASTVTPRTPTKAPSKSQLKLAVPWRRAAKTPPPHAAPFAVPALACAQDGGHYSSRELPENVVGCPNYKNPQHKCTPYCFDRFGQLSTAEALREKAKARDRSGDGASKVEGAAKVGTGSQACTVS